MVSGSFPPSRSPLISSVNVPFEKKKEFSVQIFVSQSKRFNKVSEERKGESMTGWSVRANCFGYNEKCTSLKLPPDGSRVP